MPNILIVKGYNFNLLAGVLAQESQLATTLVPITVATLALIGVVAQAWINNRDVKKTDSKIGEIGKAVGVNNTSLDLADVINSIQFDLQQVHEIVGNLSQWKDTWMDADGVLIDGRSTQRDHNKLDRVIEGMQQSILELNRHNKLQSKSITSAIDMMSMKLELIQNGLRSHVEWEEGQKYIDDEMLNGLMNDIRILNIKLEEKGMQ